MRLAARRPELLRSLTLMETTADPEPAHHLPRYRLLTFVARWLGTSFVREPAMKIMFGRTFMSDPARQAERERWRRELSTVRRSIWRSIQGVISRAGVYEELSRISLPTLILVGEEDTATTPEEAERMHAAISSSRLIRMPRCGHTSTLENPEAVNTALLSLLDPLSLSQSA
ncbi:MAG TPA: alpha/beta fold hydrolase, partial [Myxococcaceae bacterium]|nr:alpha/beta fold hydrolase [Myxococcaceae bacterium]